MTGRPQKAVAGGAALARVYGCGIGDRRGAGSAAIPALLRVSTPALSEGTRPPYGRSAAGFASASPSRARKVSSM